MRIKSRIENDRARRHSIFTIDLVAVSGIAAGGLLASLLWATPTVPGQPDESMSRSEMGAQMQTDSPDAATPGQDAKQVALQQARNSWVYSP